MSRPTWPALLVVGLTAASCGYTAGYDLTREGVRTVAVEVADNSTFRQRLEIPLTTELHRALPIHAGLRASEPAQADAVLTVEIVDVQGRSLVQGGSADPVREGALLFTVRAVLEDRRTGRVLRDRGPPGSGRIPQPGRGNGEVGDPRGIRRHRPQDRPCPRSRFLTN